MKISVGKPRQVSVSKTKPTSTSARAMMLLGIVSLCLCLILPLSKAEAEPEYIPVMAQPKEEIALPEKDTSLEQEWSFYDYIGTIFAELFRNVVQ